MKEELQVLTEEDVKCLDDKNPQTTYKIAFITKYVENWLRVLSNASFSTNLNFIDCMCNAGVYLDTDYCTAMNVLDLFYDYAKKFPNKKYSLYLNDNSDKKINILKKIIKAKFETVPNNLSIYVDNEDVNDYIKKLVTKENLFAYPNSTILYVDPYDFGTVHIPTLSSFVRKYYCEVIFNLFTSDFIRNKLDKRISAAIDDKNVKLASKEDLVNYIVSKLKINKMKYSFQYAFRIQTNAELYQIMFLTPSDTGLDKLKEALWDIFNGSAFYRNKKEKNPLQISLFNDKMDIELRLTEYAAKAKEIVINTYSGRIVTYQQIADVILPYSMLKSSDLISCVIKPLIDEGKMVKMNQGVSSRNYKGDSFQISGRI